MVVKSMYMQLNSVKLGTLGTTILSNRYSNLDIQLSASQLLEKSGKLECGINESFGGHDVLDYTWQYEYIVPTDDEINLDPDLVSLPPQGVAGDLSFLHGLPVDVREKFAQGKIVKMDRTDKMHRPFLWASPDNYRKIIKRLAGLGMVALRRKRPRIVNGIFVVTK